MIGWRSTTLMTSLCAIFPFAEASTPSANWNGSVERLRQLIFSAFLNCQSKRPGWSLFGIEKSIDETVFHFFALYFVTFYKKSESSEGEKTSIFDQLHRKNTKQEITQKALRISFSVHLRESAKEIDFIRAVSNVSFFRGSTGWFSLVHPTRLKFLGAPLKI